MLLRLRFSRLLPFVIVFVLDFQIHLKHNKKPNYEEGRGGEAGTCEAKQSADVTQAEQSEMERTN